MEFAKNLKDLRIKHGLTQEQLGKMLGVTGANCTRYEKGLAQPKISTLIKMAEIFGVTVDTLLGVNTTNITLDTDKERKIVAAYWSKLLEPNFKLETKNDYFSLIALKDFDSKFFKQVKANDIIKVSQSDLIVLTEEIKQYYDKQCSKIYNEIALNCFTTFAQMYNWRKDSEKK